MIGWSLVYDRFAPEKERLREALCTPGNGYFATRGARLRLCVRYRGQALAIEFTPRKVRVSGCRSPAGGVRIALKDEIRELPPGEARELAL